MGQSAEKTRTPSALFYAHLYPSTPFGHSPHALTTNSPLDCLLNARGSTSMNNIIE